MKIITITFLFFAVGSCCFAQNAKTQNAWTLEQCINYAIENNRTIKQEEYNARVSENSLRQSKADLLPYAGVNATHEYTYGRSVDQYTNTITNTNVRSNSLTLYGSVTLFDGFQQVNSIIQNKYNLKANQQSIKKAKNDISLQIASYYLQVLFAQEMVEMAARQLEITNRQIEEIKIKVEAGRSAKGSLLEIQAQAAGEEVELVSAKNDLILANLRLRHLLELPRSTGFSIIKPNLEIDENNVFIENSTEIYNTAEQNMPEIKIAELNVRTNEKELAISRGKILPELSFSAYYYTGYSDARQMVTGIITQTGEIGYTSDNVTVYQDYEEEIYGAYPFMDQLHDNASKNLEFSLSIPIFSNLSTYHSISNAKLGILKSKNELEMAKQELFEEIQQAEVDANAALAKYYSTQRSKQSYQEAFNYANEKFKVGLINSTEYNTAKNQLTKAESELLQAKYEYIFKTKILDFYMGKPISLQY